MFENLASETIFFNNYQKNHALYGHKWVVYNIYIYIFCINPQMHLLRMVESPPDWPKKWGVLTPVYLEVQFHL